MSKIKKLPFLIPIIMAMITVLSGLYNGKSFDIMAKETCFVIVISYAFGVILKHALIILIKDVIRKNIEEANAQRLESRKIQAKVEAETADRHTS